MKGKKLNYSRLIIVNLIILLIFISILIKVPNKPEINLVITSSYIMFASFFNLIIIEK